MKIGFHGAARTVTGSQHLLHINGYKILLECGLYQGKRKEAFERNSHLPYDPGELDAVILSHAHIDHSGNLPNLVRNGYNGPIYATHATAHLANIMLMDSGHIQESDAVFINKKKGEPGKPAVEPLYTLEDAARVAQYFKSVAYDQPFEAAPGVEVKLVEAGHILGSAAVVLDIEERSRSTWQKRRLWFSGDIGRRNLPLIRDPVLPEGADLMIMECTYGDRVHRSPQEAFEELQSVTQRTLSRGGKVIIPAFAVGRTQELVYAFHQMMESRAIPSVPVFVDSPLAVNASDIFRQHKECFDEETELFISEGRHKEALGFARLTYTRSAEQSKALNERKDPMIIISASGMAEAGRILHHLKNNIENPLNTVLIVSWQAPHTLGRRLADQDERVKIFGEVYERRAEVEVIEGYSAHAGQPLLLEYAQSTHATLKQTFLVHGEQGPAETLMGKMRERGMGGVRYPELNEVVEV